MPWQDTASRYLTATGADGKHLYREVAIVVARQQGKTTLMKPIIVRALMAGKRVLHIAQTRELPRVMFSLIASTLDESLFPKRRGKGGKMQTVWPRYGSGQEEILLENGGSYRIAASSSGGARGWSIDLVIFDEMREMTSFDPIDAAQPTQMMSEDPQTIYLSNAGTDASVVLNAIRKRGSEDPSLAYLEWSASPERAPDDREGWAEANPALGHYPQVLVNLEQTYRSHLLGGTMASFETENLCRWVPTMRPKLVEPEAWLAGMGPLEAPIRPALAFSMDPEGKRASAAIAWRRTDGSIGLRLTYNVTGSPIDTDRLGEDLRKDAARMGIKTVGFDPLTDAELAKGFKKPVSISGGKFANATAQFCNLVAAGKVKWADCDAVTDDLTWTARKVDHESQSYEAVRVKDDRPITASLAAIRAVWLASVPPLPSPKVK
jgi:phage terminase large subunit-like protein